MMSNLFIISILVVLLLAHSVDGFLVNSKLTKQNSIFKRSRGNEIRGTEEMHRRPMPFGQSLIKVRSQPLHDLLGLGPGEIAIALVAALVLFGPETLKSLSKDVGRAAAELKEIPKTFKEGMDEGAESAQVAKMKKIAEEKRKKRDEKVSKADEEEEEEE